MQSTKLVTVVSVSRDKNLVSIRFNDGTTVFAKFQAQNEGLDEMSKLIKPGQNAKICYTKGVKQRTEKDATCVHIYTAEKTVEIDLSVR